MTVRELIHRLKYYDPNAEVLYKENMYKIEHGASIHDIFPTDNLKGDKFVILLSDKIEWHNGGKNEKSTIDKS